ncbi:efflux RND transporter periplasmic adaptor subunit [Rhodobacter maris]|uniref:RND family efflux transporter MFP subunit n=1 Tax=Rhodobacter maris TaxID=446682 RepID=A0A285TB10_9RHOB|nr:efflux RND transporter periplasmic adaptor subunit [Rhodobacter maris]SOC18987.1 RND family efflux transporter MFP subunit [Rhodobacter maris]
MPRESRFRRVGALMRRASGVVMALPFLVLPAGAEEALPVRIVTAHTAPVLLHFELSGTIEAAEAVPAGFRNGGRLLALNAEVGDRVEAGAVLAEIDPTQAAAALRAAQAQDAAAEATLTQAEQALTRAAGLAARGFATQAALDAATEAALSARSARDQAHAARAKATQTLADCTLFAPVSGIVTARTAEPGQIVEAAQTVLTLARDGAREAVFYIPDFAALDRFQGRAVTLHPLGESGPERQATVTEIAPLVSSDGGTVRVKAELAPAPDLPPPGLGTTVVTAVDLSYGAAMALPWQALVSQGGKAAVWTLDAVKGVPGRGRVALTPVRVLRYTDHAVEIAEGLPEGALVVTRGAHLLYPGQLVQVQEGQE